MLLLLPGCTRTIDLDLNSYLSLVLHYVENQQASFGWSRLPFAISYPEPWNKGKALGYWLTCRLSGQIIGGAINLGLNTNGDEAGKVSYTVSTLNQSHSRQ